jgi:hypothetical protein
LQLTLPLIPAILLASGIFCVVMANIVFYSMLGEVNGRRSPNEHIPMVFVSTRFLKVVRLHKELFPQSKKMQFMYALFFLGFALIISTFFSGNSGLVER